MNGREMNRRTSAKQANAQTQHNQTKRLMVESADRLSPPKQQKAVLATTTTTLMTTSIRKRNNVQATNLARI